MKNCCLIAMTLLAVSLRAQTSKTIPTSSNCNAIAVGSNNHISNYCVEGLTKADAQKLVQEYQDLIQIIGKNSVTISMVLNKLELMKKDLAKSNLALNQASVGVGIANVGGTVIDSPVTAIFGVARPPPDISYTQSNSAISHADPNALLKSQRGIKVDPPTVTPIVSVEVTLKGDFVQPAFRATCNKPCTIYGLVPDPWPGTVQIDSYRLTPINTYVITVMSPHTLLMNTKIRMSVYANDGGPFELLSIEPFMIP